MKPAFPSLSLVLVQTVMIVITSFFVDGRILVEQMEIPSEAMKQMINSHGYLPNWPYRGDMNPFLSHVSEGWRLDRFKSVKAQADDNSSDNDDENYQFNDDRSDFADLVKNTFGK